MAKRKVALVEQKKEYEWEIVFSVVIEEKWEKIWGSAG
jgi:hypothetical protein